MSAGSSPARAWLATALEDLEVGQELAESGRHAHACFFSHQAAEKAVKAVHYARGARLVFGHGIRELIERLESGELAELLPVAQDLDLYYVPTRYPNGLVSGTPMDAFGAAQARRALTLAKAVVDGARGIILGGAGPSPAP